MPLKAGLFYQFGPYRLDAEQRLLWNRDELVPLTLKALETLLALVENPGRLVGKDELMKKLWPDTFVEENNLAFNISVLRKALTDGQSGFGYIETIPRRGYRFIAPVTETSRAIPNPEAAESPVTPPAEAVAVPAHGSNGTTLEDAAAGLATVLEPNVDASRQGYPQWAPLPTAASESQRSGAEARKKLWFTVAAVAGVTAALAACGWLLVRPLPSPTAHNPKQLTNDGLEKGQLATDGQRLYFTERVPTGELVLKQMSVNRGEPTSMPSPAGDLGVSDVSPDSSSLLLGRAAGADTPIWLLPLPGGSPRHLGNLVGHDASWSPDGGKVAYCNGHDLYVANEDGSDSRRIATVRGEVLWPHWSPDGALLRFTESSPPGIAGSRAELWETSGDGTGLHPVLLGWNKRPSENHGSWTPDGKLFVFESEKDGQAKIWAIREKGGGFHWRSREPMKLTESSQSCYYPLPSPDSKRLFFLGRTEQGHLEYFSQAEKQFVPFLGGISAERLAYSPDGAQLAYVKYPDGTLWCMRRDGSEARQLIFSPTKVQGLAWSPDGSQIAFNAWAAANPFQNYREGPRRTQGAPARALWDGRDTLVVRRWHEDRFWRRAR